MSGLENFISDLKTSRYAQFWTLLWIVGLFVIAIGSIGFIAQARDNRREMSYRMMEQHENKIPYPNFRFEVLNDSSVQFSEVVCASHEGLVRMISCPGKPSSQCQESSRAEHHLAVPEYNWINCSIYQQIGNPNDTEKPNFVILFSILDNKNVTSSKAYLQPSDVVEVYLEKIITQFDHNQKAEKYLVKPVYVTNRADLNSVNVTLAFESFNVKHWIRYDPFTVWNAMAAIGGLILFVYAIHAVLMAFISLLSSPADTMTFSSGNQYAVV